MTMAFTGPSTYTQVVNLTPSDPRCSGVPLACTIAVTLLAGSYTVTINTYDEAPVSGVIPGGAHVLSTASNVHFTMFGGQDNSVNITLDGVPATLAVTGLPPAVPGTAFSAPKSFTVVARDAAQYIIVGTYSTPVTLSDSDTSGATTIATSGADNPPAGQLLSSTDTATIDYNGATISPATISASANGATTGVGFFGIAQVFVANSAVGTVVAVPPGCESSSCTYAIGGGFARPYGVASDSSGNVYVSDVSSNDVYVVPPGCITSTCVTTIGGGFLFPAGLAVDGSGNVYVGDEYHDAVKVIPAGCTNAACVTTIGGFIAGPSGVAVDSSGNVYVASFVSLGVGNTDVYEIPPGCVTSLCVIPLGGGFSFPYGVAIDGSGNVYVAGNVTALVTKMPAGCASAACVTTIGGGFFEPAGIAVDSAGNAYATDFSAGTAGEIPAGCASASCVVSLGGGFNFPVGIAVAVGTSSSIRRHRRLR